MTLSNNEQTERPRCAVRGLVSPGTMCGQVMMGGYCGHDGACRHKVLPVRIQTQAEANAYWADKDYKKWVVDFTTGGRRNRRTAQTLVGAATSAGALRAGVAAMEEQGKGLVPQCHVHGAAGDGAGPGVCGNGSEGRCSMRPTQHPSNNDVLRAPPGVSAEQCKPLAITRVMFTSGMPAVWSYWEPSPEERAAIAAGAKVRLSCWGMTHPPVSIGVDGVEERPW